MNKVLQNKDQVLSNTIAFVRFPLIMAIVLIHTYISDQPNVGGVIMIPSGKFPAFDTFEYFLRQCIAELAVPTFFLMSGFLFFYKTNSFTLEKYEYKLKKRFHSLLIPYIVWNLIYMVYMILVQTLVPSMTSPDRKMILDYSMIDFLDSFWHYDGVSYGGPIYGPLWFIRDLIVLVILSPIFYYVIKKTKYLFILLISLLYIAGIGLLTPGLGMQSILFFCIGAYYSINKKNLVCMKDSHIYILLFIGIILLFLDITLRGNVINAYLHRMFIVIMTLILLPMVSKFVAKTNNKSLYPLLAESSFFVYVTHRFIITLPNKFWVLLVPVNSFTASLALILIPIVVSLICFLIYLILKRISPKFAAFLIGGR